MTTIFPLDSFTEVIIGTLGLTVEEEGRVKMNASYSGSGSDQFVSDFWMSPTTYSCS